MDILQVAKRAKVSTATVSRVLNGFPGIREKTRLRVRRAIAEMNYVPNPNARSLRVGRSRLFGLIISDVNNPFFPELIDAFEALAASHGIGVIFTHTNYDPARLHSSIRRMVQRGVVGVSPGALRRPAARARGYAAVECWRLAQRLSWLCVSRGDCFGTGQSCRCGPLWEPFSRGGLLLGRR